MQLIVLTAHFIYSNGSDPLSYFPQGGKGKISFPRQLAGKVGKGVIRKCVRREKSSKMINNMQHTRKKFITRLIQAGLLGILLLITFLLGSKTVSGKDCSACPGNGICSGDTDCSKY
jgi:hypothetical protein